MIGLGFSLALREGRPRLICARAAQSDGREPTLAVILEHWADRSEDETLQLRNLAARIETLLVTESGDAAVIRRMDWTGTMKRELVAKRGQAEGVTAAVVRGRVSACRLLAGSDIARLCDTSKADIESRASAVVGNEAKEAGAAALAALVLAGT